MSFNEMYKEKIKKILFNIKILYLPLLFVLFFIGQSGFGKNLFNKFGLDFVLIIIFIVIYFCKTKYVPKKITISYIILIIYTLFITILGEDYKNWFISIGTLSSIAIFSNINFSLFEIKKSLSITFILGLSILFIFNYTIYLENWNPNSICIFASLALLNIIILYKLEKNVFKKILNLTFIIISIYMILLTENRNTMLIFVIAMIAIVIVPEKFWNKKRITAFFIIGVAMSAIIPNIYKFIYQDDVLNLLAQKLYTVFGKETLVSGREEFWYYCQELIKNNFIFGNGESLYNYIYAHNMYFSIIYFFGLVGYILYIIFIYNAIKSANVYLNKKTNKNTQNLTLYCILAFISILFGQIMENTLFTANSNMFMPYIFISIVLNKNERKEINETSNCFYTNL